MGVTDRLHVDLHAIPLADALLKISRWFEDCQQHLDLGRDGGLPTAPFSMDSAWIVTRLAAGDPGQEVALSLLTRIAAKPDYAPGDEVVVTGRQVDAMGALITQEWFDTAVALEGDHEVGAGGELIDLLCGPGIARPTGIISGPDGRVLEAGK